MARQQRRALRTQVRASRHTSVLGPVLLIGLGMGLFLVQLGRLSWASLLGWLNVWWPLILVGAGVVVLGEWLLDAQRAARSGEVLPRRALGAGGVLLLIAFGLTGAAVSGVRHGSAWASEHWTLAQDLGLDDWLAQRTEDTQSLQAPLPSGSTLIVEDPKGTVVVTGSSEDGSVHVTAHRRLWGWQGSDLERRKARNPTTLRPAGAALLLHAAGEGRDETDLTIEVPHTTTVEVRAGKGELSVSELRGKVQIDDHAGNVVLAALTGDVHLATHDDDASVSGRSITGEVAVDGRSGDLTFSDIDGPLTLHGDFFGTTHLERIRGAVRFKSSYTDLACEGVRGELNIEGRSELEARDLAGEVVLTTSERDVSLSELHRGATVKDKNGSVSLTFAELQAPVEVATTDGSVKVQLPEKAAFHVQAETEDGKIENDFDLPASHEDDHTTLAGQVLRGGPSILLHTTEGDVSLRKAGVKEEKSDE